MDDFDGVFIPIAEEIKDVAEVLPRIEIAKIGYQFPAPGLANQIGVNVPPLSMWFPILTLSVPKGYLVFVSSLALNYYNPINNIEQVAWTLLVDIARKYEGNEIKHSIGEGPDKPGKIDPPFIVQNQIDFLAHNYSTTKTYCFEVFCTGMMYEITKPGILK